MIMALKVFLKKGANQLYFLFRIAGRYNLKINPKPSYLREKKGSICDMICIRMNDILFQGSGRRSGDAPPIVRKYG
jgi:hypothetical protein